MGFGSYDETEQENQTLDTEDMETEEENTREEHNGDMEFELEDTESALDRLEEMRDEDE